MTRQPAPSAPPAPQKKSDRTRAAILDAARQLFAERGHGATTVRDVAALAGVDPALVIRYFGSKEDLFVRAAEFKVDLPAGQKLDPLRVGEQLVRHFLAVWEGPQADMGMAVLLRSAASNEMSAEKLRGVFMMQVMPAIGRLGPKSTAARRAGLVATQMLGLALCRYVLRLAPVTDLSPDEIVKLVAPTIQRYALGES